MKKILLLLIAVVCICSATAQTSVQRRFIHPGLTYTQGDLDRMKAMVEARQEPFYTAFVNFSKSVVVPGTLSAITQITESQHNNTIGTDGRRAHDNALMWHLTGTKSYADNAVKYLNRYLTLTNSSARGTAPLDNGKIYMLIEAAELMRDYPGWSTADQNKFKQMLVHPGYSQTTVPTSQISLTDANNNVTFYWNIYNFDRGRWGNQGLFAARGLISMAVFLDSEVMYDRVYRYLLGMPHRSDDIAYPPGPAKTGTMNSETAYLRDYNASYGTTPDYGFDELLKYYIYQNGQCQEACRDQGHVMAGLGNYSCIAEIAWSQGDTLYNCLDNRILTGMEYAIRYNLSNLVTFPDQPVRWEATGYSTDEADCSYDNGIFYQAWSRSGRWFGKAISPDGRGNDENGYSGVREQTAAHYKVRAGVEPEKMKWLQRSLDRMIQKNGYEQAPGSGHHYEWYGWGTLTKRRLDWMAGDPGTFVDGQRVSGMPSAPCTVNAVDYDYHAGNGEGLTYHNAKKVKSTLYRTDGTIEIARDGDDYVVTDMVAGEWMNYSVIFPAPVGNTTAGVTKKYNIYATYKSAGTGAKLFAAVNNDETRKGKELEPASTWTERCLGTFTVPCGAAVVRIYVKGVSNLLQLKNIRIEPLEMFALTKVDLASKAQSIRIYNASNEDITATSNPDIIPFAMDGDYSQAINMPTKQFLVFDFGENGFDISKVVLYNNVTIQDTREMAKVLGSTKDAPYTGAWSQSATDGAFDIMRTNGSIYGNIPVISNTWTTTGSYSVGPVGKYRYFAPYNWSVACQISEVEIYSVLNTSSVTEDKEPSAEWDNTDDTFTSLKAIAAETSVQISINGNVVSVQGASFIEAFTLTGSRLATSKSSQISLPQGFYILRMVINGQVVTKKVVIKT